MKHISVGATENENPNNSVVNLYPDFDVDSLFNLNEDGAEQTNLIDEASQSTTLAELGVSIDAHDAATVASVATADVGDLECAAVEPETASPTLSPTETGSPTPSLTASPTPSPTASQTLPPTTSPSLSPTAELCSLSPNDRCGVGSEDESATCCEGRICARKSATYGQCKTSCPDNPAWDCYEEPATATAAPTPSPTTSEPATATAAPTPSPTTSEVDPGVESDEPSMENKLLTDVKDNLPVVVGILLLVLGIVVVYCCCCTKKKVKREQMALRSIGGAGRWDKKDNELL
jgi:hypothetical protein